MFNARTVPLEIATDQGGREYQQDRAAFARESGHLVAAVADGMGSGKNSDRIAELAATLATRIAWTYGPEHPEYAVTAAAECVRDLTDADRGEYDNTTLVLATVEAPGAVPLVRVAWVGDSRAYVLTRRGRLVPLTKDHNRAPWAPNVLTRCLLGDDLYHRHDRGAECVKHEPEAAVYADVADPAVMVALRRLRRPRRCRPRGARVVPCVRSGS